MKKLFWNGLKYALLFIIIISSGFAIYLDYTGSSFDPIREIQKLKSENRRDDALDLAKFYGENQTGNKEKIAAIKDDLEYTTTEKIKSYAWDGFILGRVYDSYSGIGAISADLLVIGDIRDLGIQGWEYLTGGQDFSGSVTILSAAGIGLSSIPFFDGTDAMFKHIYKYLKKVPASINKGLLKKFLSGKVSPANCKKMWELFRMNHWSIPRTASCLSNIKDIKHLDTATDLITKYKTTGSIFIHLTGENGLNLFKTMPNRLKHRLIWAFKHNPKVVIGISKSHLATHLIKVLDKFGLVVLAIPITTFALILSFLPVWLPWMLLIGSSGYTMLSLTRKLKYRK